MAYQWDVFLSYRRFREWPKWVDDHFLPLFTHYLGEELGRDADVFVDKNAIESGVVWPYKLAEGLAESRVLVCLWSRQYFNSPWCLAELGHMRAREAACGLANVQNPEGLILPVVLHDGEDFPADVRHIQCALFQDVVNLRMATGSFVAERLASRVRDWVPDVRSAIERAPGFDPNWRELTAIRFIEALQQSREQKTVPNLGAL
jgi:hypothetical protein